MTDESAKIFLSADKLLQDSFILAQKIYKSGIRPDWLVGVWRGGTPVAIAVHEYFSYKDCDINHMAIQATSYTGITDQSNKIKLRGLKDLRRKTKAGDTVLVIDDVFDTGRSMEAIYNNLEDLGLRLVSAFVWYKPDNNKTELKPDFYLKTTDRWIVFPHELMGLNEDEINRKSVKIP